MLGRINNNPSSADKGVNFKCFLLVQLDKSNLKKYNILCNQEFYLNWIKQMNKIYVIRKISRAPGVDPKFIKDRPARRLPIYDLSSREGGRFAALKNSAMGPVKAPADDSSILCEIFHK